VFVGAVRAVAGVVLAGRDRVAAAVRGVPDPRPRDSEWCAGREHCWARSCTTVIVGKPLLVEYRCRRCGAWTVEENTTW
jgi:hypothetical protein